MDDNTVYRYALLSFLFIIYSQAMFNHVGTCSYHTYTMYVNMLCRRIPFVIRSYRQQISQVIVALVHSYVTME